MGSVQSFFSRRAAANLEQNQIREREDLRRRQRSETITTEAEHEREIEKKREEQQVELKEELSKSESADIDNIELRHEKEQHGLKLAQLNQHHRTMLEQLEQTQQQDILHAEQRVRLRNKNLKNQAEERAQEDETIKSLRKVKEREHRIEAEKLKSKQDKVWLQQHKEQQEQRRKRRLGHRVTPIVLKPIEEEGSGVATPVEVAQVEVEA